MAIQTTFVIDHQGSAADAVEALIGDNTQTSGLKLQKFIKGIVSGMDGGLVAIGVAAVKAAGTFVLTSVVATDVVTINGVSFTGIASGATGNQFNIGGDDTVTAANLVTAINASASALVSEHVLASSVGTTVTVTALRPGTAGNAITITSADATIVASGARLTGGTNGSTTSSTAYGTN